MDADRAYVSGNHELYVTDVAYQVFDEFQKYWGDKYLTSNVQVLNPATGQWEYIGKTYKYFTTQKGEFFPHSPLSATCLSP